MLKPDNFTSAKNHPRKRGLPPGARPPIFYNYSTGSEFAKAAREQRRERRTAGVKFILSTAKRVGDNFETAALGLPSVGLRILRGSFRLERLLF
jgi:DNA invertase Pin-like site-specific DNA recombinase